MRREPAGEYERRKLWEAIRILASHEGPIQQRLTFAAVPILQVRGRPLPAELEGEFNAMIKELTADPLSNDHGYTPRKLSAERCSKLAEQMFSIYTRACGHAFF